MNEAEHKVSFEITRRSTRKKLVSKTQDTNKLARNTAKQGSK